MSRLGEGLLRRLRPGRFSVSPTAHPPPRQPKPPPTALLSPPFARLFRAGKTLAFVLPCIELMVRTKFMVRNGTACIMIAPVRELCLQIHGVVAQMLKYHASHTHGCCFGGNNPKHEVSGARWPRG